MRLNKNKSRLLTASILAAATLASANSASATVYFQENFNPGFFATLPDGWVSQNNSQPLGAAPWFQGIPGAFPAFNGVPNSYASANFNSTTGSGTISNWLVTPVINAAAGSRVSFVTRGINPQSDFADRLELRSSPTGSSNVGTSATDIGSFTDLLLTVNPELSSDPTYPTEWTRFEATLPTAYSGRLAFRYFVTDGGPAGANSERVGVDALQVADPSEPLPQPGLPPQPTPSATRTTVGGSLTSTFATVGEVDWYKFDFAGGQFTVDTNGSTLEFNDTELGLFSSTGALVAEDDDSGTGTLSRISIPDLAAGTYFLAASTWDVFFANGFNAVPIDNGESGTYVINGLTLAPLVKGDFGGNESSDGSFNSPDGTFDGLDIEGFLLALNSQASYLALNPSLSSSLVGLGDFGGNESTDGSFNTPDGAFDGLDIEGFLLALNDPAGYAAIQPPAIGGISAIPEPAALGLLAPMGMLLSRRRR